YFMTCHRQVPIRPSALAALQRTAIVLLLLATPIWSAAVPAYAAETVTLAVDATRNVKPISRYIYGINAPLNKALNLTFRRMGSSRWTAYKWIKNDSNAGGDYLFQNDDYLGGGNTPVGALIGAINSTKASTAALLVTVPINAYGADDKNG